eukprot:SAG22_NODE_1177_length_5246_cov_48.458908_4_plen_344_part_00
MRIRGSASECQVWLRHLDNGDELYVVLFNSGVGSCAGEGNATMTVTWEELGVNPECMLSVEELISGEYWGSLQQQVSVSIRKEASAALRMHPHCHISPPPAPPAQQHDVPPQQLERPAAAAASAAAAVAPPPSAKPPPPHIKIMSAWGYNASTQAGWCSFGKSFNLSALLAGYKDFGLPGLYRIDCVGCYEEEDGGGKFPKDPGFAAGVICDHRNCSTCKNVYHMCEKRRGDATNWDEQTLQLLQLAKPHLISGALRGVFLGDELSASGKGQAPADPEALSFEDLERWIDLTRGFLDGLAPARRAAGVEAELILYYTSSDWMASWPHIPRNLTLFSMDDCELS